MNKICSNCGLSNVEGSYFCQNCGQTLREKSEPPYPGKIGSPPNSIPACSEPPRFGSSDTVRSFDGMDKLDPTVPASDSEEKKSSGFVRRLFRPFLGKKK